MRRRAFLVDALRGAGAAVVGGVLGGCHPAGTRAGHPPRRSPTSLRPAAGTCGSRPGRLRPLRGAWIATFRNMDWPSRPGLPAASQQRELTALLELARRLGLSAVLLQVRPTADALYPSPYEPWSKWASGRQGRPPGYDPLAFAISAAHRRGLELHAWFNPFRVSEGPQLSRLAAGHPGRRHPEWVIRYGGQLWYDPGNPAARALAAAVIGDVARRYDIDGVHLDDYFYPYPVPGEEFGDDVTYRRYGTGFASRADWRRSNVNLLVAEVSRRVRVIRPRAKFGVSPFGIWRNAAVDPAGSPTSGLQAYDDLYADARAWIRGGWLDYIAPQVYWEISDPVAPYEQLVRWWARTVTGSGCELYVGQAAYRAQSWPDPRELARHLAFDHAQPQVAGELFFHARSLARTGVAAQLGHGEPPPRAEARTGCAPGNREGASRG